MQTLTPSQRLSISITAVMVVFGGLLCGPAVLAQGPNHQDGTLALIGPTGAYLWDLGARGNRPAESMGGPSFPSAIIADLHRGLLWIAGEAGLTAHGIDGAQLFSVPLTAPGEDGAAAEGVVRHMDVYAVDGSLWVAAGNHAWNVSTGGQELGYVELPDAVVDLEIDSEAGELWLATAGRVAAYDVISGDEIRGLAELPEDVAITALTLGQSLPDTETGATRTEVWLADVATDGRLLRFDAVEGTLTLDRPVFLDSAVSQMTSDRAGGLWLISGTELGRYITERDQLRTQSPFPQPEIELTALAWDTAFQAVWVAGGDELARIGGTGWALGRSRERVGVGVSGIAVAVDSTDDIPPELSVVSPSEGQEVNERRPEIKFAYSDEGSGVRPDSLEIRFNGNSAAAACSYFQTEARCQPNQDLSVGEIVVEAIVADTVGNRSSPASQTFTVTDNFEGPGGGGGGGVYTPSVSPRGFRPNSPFDFGEIDSIDLANGSATLRIPLGQVFEVGPMIRYQVLAVHGTAAWDYIPVPCPSGQQCTEGGAATYAVPALGSNAGLGWMVHPFGRLYSPEVPTGLDPANCY